MNCAWDYVSGEPAPPLRRYVQRYGGLRANTTAVWRRRAFPSTTVMLVIDLGPALVVRTAATGPSGASARTGLVAGIHDSASTLEHPGRAECVAITFTALGARVLLGRAMREITRNLVDLDDIVGPEARALVDSVRAAPTWPARFRTVDAFLMHRLAAARHVSDALRWAIERIDSRDGKVPIAGLSRELGYSRKHLHAVFGEELGLGPKLYAQITRFEATMRLLEAGPTPRWSELAYRLGYYDQAHFNRAFRRFANDSPSALLRARAPEGSGFHVRELDDQPGDIRTRPTELCSVTREAREQTREKEP